SLSEHLWRLRRNTRKTRRNKEAPLCDSSALVPAKRATPHPPGPGGRSRRDTGGAIAASGHAKPITTGCRCICIAVGRVADGIGAGSIGENNYDSCPD